LEAIGHNYASRAESGIAWLRLASVALFAGAEQLPPPGDHQSAFFTVLGLYGAWSLGVVWITRRSALSDAGGNVVMAVDVLVITALDSLSGGPFSLTRLGYFFIPVEAAFRYRWKLTLAVTAVVVTAYVVDPVLDIGPDQGNLAGFVALHAAILAWIGVACAALSAAVAARSAQIAELVGDREHLLSQVLAAETRERRALAEGLHDGPIQSLLAARHDLEAVVARSPSVERPSAQRAVEPASAERVALERADETLLQVVRELRSAVFELHPHVLEEAGLDAAVRQIAEIAALRGGFDLALELDELPQRMEQDRLLFSVARELLTNVVRHAEASHVTVSLHDSDGERVLAVVDDGRGVDPRVLTERLARGHIGLASQRVRLESAGGQLDLGPRPDGGTSAVARLPL
jgi:two-component system NarL family sensor kinase